MVARDGEWGWAKWVKQVKRYKLAVVASVSPGDVMSNMVLAGTYVKHAKRVELKKSSTQGKKKKKDDNYIWLRMLTKLTVVITYCDSYKCRVVTLYT